MSIIPTVSRWHLIFPAISSSLFFSLTLVHHQIFIHSSQFTTTQKKEEFKPKKLIKLGNTDLFFFFFRFWKYTTTTISSHFSINLSFLQIKSKSISQNQSSKTKHNTVKKKGKHNTVKKKGNRRGGGVVFRCGGRRENSPVRGFSLWVL